MQIERMLVLSTCHIEESTAKALNNKEFEKLTIEVRETGYLINTVMLQEYRNTNDEVDISNYPKGLKACIKMAQENNCDWILLDCDGPVEDDILPAYEW